MPENENLPSLFLDELHVKGFKSIEDLEARLNPGLNILIGKNGAGKSNFLEFLDSAIATIYKKKGFSFQSAFLKLNDRNNNRFDLNIRKPTKKNLLGESNRVNDELYHHSLFINDSIVFDSYDEEIIGKEFDFNGKKIKSSRSINTILLKLGHSFISPLYIRFNLTEQLDGIATPGIIQIPLIYDFIDWEFGKTTRFLTDIIDNASYSFQNTYEDKLMALPEDRDTFEREKIIQSVDVSWFLENLIIPEESIGNLIRFSPIQGLRFNEGINIYRDEKSITAENIKLEFLINERWIPWSHLSDGTKRLFYLITEITNNKTGLILIEEPELGIHPHQFDLLMQFIKEQSLQKQIILSTHSPKALDHLEEDELDKILIAVYDREKGTQLHHLNPEQIHKAKTYMNEVGYLSDYWSLSDLEE
ncbi:hypothetical protein AY601_3453 [Pedobacter cryoconitis]|uniref:ATPase AAA-type core domain-containing protein n=1 Tax=Pedobacter cryoconitis TaxID=188932 RepID=A0A127VHB6_9SPHI|nr:ATP-binding protein [Pedobacter cryoconitis]AMQ00319.1 hypothetical protein AY601_3453 [Pedobacter cryoconitis]